MKNRDRTTCPSLDPLHLQSHAGENISFLNHNFTCTLTVALQYLIKWSSCLLSKYLWRAPRWAPRSDLWTSVCTFVEAVFGCSRSSCGLCELKPQQNTDGLSGLSAARLVLVGRGYMLHNLPHESVYMFPQQVFEDCLLNKLSNMSCVYVLLCSTNIFSEPWNDLLFSKAILRPECVVSLVIVSHVMSLDSR